MVSQGRSKPSYHQPPAADQPLSWRFRGGARMPEFPRICHATSASLLLPWPSTTLGIATTVTHQHSYFPLLPLLNIAKYDAQAMVPAWQVKFQRYDTVIATRCMWLNCSIYALNPQVIMPVFDTVPRIPRLLSHSLVPSFLTSSIRPQSFIICHDRVTPCDSARPLDCCRLKSNHNQTPPTLHIHLHSDN